MKRIISLLLVLAMVFTLLPVVSFAADGESVDFVVLSTTDMHGKCWDKNVLTDANENNTMLRVSTAVQQYRSEYGENLLLIDNGDTYQGTPVSTVQLGKITSGESDLPAAMALCLGDIGYDVSVLGNHEFNYPWSTMSGIYAYLAERGVPVITANLYYDGTDGVHEKGENVFTPYLIKTIKIGETEHKIGVLGFENTDCTRWDVPDNYPGISFCHPDNPQRSMVWEAQRYIPQMQADGCEFIIVSYHSGLGSTSGDLVFTVNSEGQVARMIAGCEGIDMVIAGHDHSSSYSNTYLQDKNGKDVLVVNGGGQQLTQSIFTFTEGEDGKLAYTVKETKNLGLSNFAVDQTLKAKIQPYADMAIEYVNQTAGTAVGEWDTSSNYYLEQTDTIDLINDVQMVYGSKYMAKKYDTEEEKTALYAATGLDHIEVDVSAASPVTSNNYYVKPGEITMKTIVQMYKYDNNVLYLLPLTGQQIKDVLEQNAATRLKATVKNGAVTYSAIGDNFTNVVFGGLNFTYDMYQPEGSRVVIEGLSNGREWALDKTYVVACNSYHLGNAGCGFGAYSTTDSVWNQNDDLGGSNIQEAILEYIQDKGEFSTEPFIWSWKLDYTGDLSVPVGLAGDMVAQKTDAVADGDQIVIYYDADSTVIGQDPAENDARLSAVETTAYNDYIAFSDKAAVFTVETVEGENDPFLLKSDKGYLTAGPTGNKLFYAEEPDTADCSAWYLVPVEGGFHIMNVGANYNGNYNQAIEWYSGFTTYGVKDTAIYLFNLYKLVDTAKRVDTLTDGRQYVIYLDSEGLSVGTAENSGGLAAVENTVSGDFMLLPLTEGTLVATAEIGEDGKIAFVSEDGKYLTSKPTGNGIYLADEPAADELSLWQPVAVDGGFHVMNVGANYNGNHNQALEYYSGKFTTYGVKDTDIYLFNFFELAEAEAGDPCAEGHDWDEPTYVWADDYSTCTATRVCKNDETHIETETVTAAYAVETEPDCEEAGKGIYTAEFENEAFETQTETVEIEALGHDWGEPTYDWAEDYSNCTATRVCRRDHSHVETETVKPTAVRVEPTTEAEGSITYTAEFENEAFETQVEVVKLPKLNNPFVDVAEDAYYFNPVLWAVQNGITSGTSETTFSPNDKCTRAQVVTFLWRANGSPATTTDDLPFTDVKPSAYYATAVLWAVEKEVTAGTSKTTFSPNASCTRAQVVTFLWRAAGKPAASTSGDEDELPVLVNISFTDVASDAYYYDAVLWAVANDITQGTSNTTFSPNNTCTRAQVVTFLYRAAQNKS